MAAAHAAAAAAGQPLYRYLGGPDAALIPLPQIQIFGGGAHAGRRVDIQDFMVMCPAAETFAQALDWTAEVYRAAGLLMQKPARWRASPTRAAGGPPSPPTSRRSRPWCAPSSVPASRPGEQVGHRARHRRLANSAATATTGWRWRAQELDSDGMIRMLTGWIGRYPIVSIEDPLAEDDVDRLRRLHPGSRRPACRSSATISSSPTPTGVREAAARAAPPTQCC